MDKKQAKTKLINQYSKLCKEAKEKGVSNGVVQNIFLNRFKINDVEKEVDIKPKWMRKFFFKNDSRRYVFVVILVIGIISSISVYNKDSITAFVDIQSWQCIVDNNALVSELTRPLVSCDFCSFLDSVPTEFLVSAEDFRGKYAYTSVPVLIKNATGNWTAMSNFSFQFFKILYTETEGALASVDEECQFFRYNTDFDNLTQVFNMSDARANLTEGEKTWYIGW